MNIIKDPTSEKHIITYDTWGGFCEKTGLIGTQKGTDDI